MRCAQAEGTGKCPPGTAFMPTPLEQLGLNGSICLTSGLTMEELCRSSPVELLRRRRRLTGVGEEEEEEEEEEDWSLA